MNALLGQKAKSNFGLCRNVGTLGANDAGGKNGSNFSGTSGGAKALSRGVFEGFHETS